MIDPIIGHEIDFNVISKGVLIQGSSNCINKSILIMSFILNNDVNVSKMGFPIL